MRKVQAVRPTQSGGGILQDFAQLCCVCRELIMQLLKTATQPRVDRIGSTIYILADKAPGGTPPAPSPPPQPPAQPAPEPATQPVEAQPASESPSPASSTPPSPKSWTTILESGCPAAATYVIDAATQDSRQTQEVKDACANADDQTCPKACACAVGRFGRKVTVQNPGFPTLTDQHVIWQLLKSLVAAGVLADAAWDAWVLPGCKENITLPSDQASMEYAFQLLIGLSC